MKTFFPLLAAALMTLPVDKLEAACELAPFSVQEAQPAQANGWRINLNNALELKLYRPPTRISTAGNWITIEFTDDARAAIGERTKDEIELLGLAAETGVAAFWRAIFTSTSAIACELTGQMELNAQDYRTQFTTDRFAVYAFGKRDRHEFYAISTDGRDVVVNGLFRGLSTHEVHSILSTLQTVEQ